VTNKNIDYKFQKSRSLRLLLDINCRLQFLEAHSALSALIVENTRVISGGKSNEFDGIWAGSLTDATIKGQPDNETVDFDSRLNTLSEILAVTTKPILYDGDSGGTASNFQKLVKNLGQIGVAGVVIEDKEGLKQNSLLATSVQQQTSIESFVEKIRAGKSVVPNKDFMIFGRIESLITGNGMADALLRARSYILAGADGIMIHSRSKEPGEIFEFCEEFSKSHLSIPLIVVPSTFDSTTNESLWDRGVNIVIYANQLLRSAYPAMLDTAISILQHGRAAESKNKMMSIKEVLEIIPDRS
jgi:phosphoenolpyruvate phosphomutase